MSSRRRSLAFVVALSCAGAARARAEDAETPAPARIDLSAFRAGPAVGAARALWVPSDGAFADGWRDGGHGEDAAVLAFEGPPFDRYAVGHEVLGDLVRRLVQSSSSAGWTDRATEESLEVWSTADGLAKAREAVRFVEAAMAPRLGVRATLSVTPKGATASRLVATGGVALLPRRWTTAWLRTNVKRFLVDHDIEIAQESTASKPVIAALPEGEELHLRWSPGETTSVLEVFVGTVRHHDPFAVDLTGVRNLPESNSSGPVSLPQSSVRRALTAVALDARTASTATCTWEGPEGTTTLRLAVDVAPAAPADATLSGGVLGVVRAGAAYAALDGEARAPKTDDAIQRYQAAATGARGAASPEAFAQAFFVCEGSRAQVDRLRAQTVADERRLVGATIEVRCVAVPAKQLEEDVAAGRCAVGALLDPSVEADYAGAAVRAAARVPVTASVPAQVRAGASVTGFTSADVEVAQQAGGLDLHVSPAFDGWAGRVVARPVEGGGWVLAASGAYTWARPDTSTLTLSFRRSLGMASPGADNGLDRIDSPAVRTVTVPLLGTGSASVEANVAIGDDDVAKGRFAVLAVTSRPNPDGSSDSIVVLGRLSR
ncbi:MAG: hypothetical protein U1E39_03730 [Planctomycetota bacterium]